MKKEPSTIHPVHFIKFLRDQIRAGNKTLTHRVIKPQPPDYVTTAEFNAAGWGTSNKRIMQWCFNDEAALHSHLDNCKYGAAGHKLWMHEPIEILGNVFKKQVSIRYLDDDEERVVEVPDRIVPPLPGKWGGRTLPSEWARDWMEVEKVVCHHIQDITDEEAKAEGVEYESGRPGSARLEFEILWDHINGPRGYAWDKNPWAFGITFKYLPRTTCRQGY